MSDPRWTEETEKRARLAVSDPGAFLPRGDNYEESIPAWGARAVLTALAEAGLLLQPGGQVREQWARLIGGVPHPCPAGDVERCKNQPEQHVRRIFTEWPDGTELRTPWLPVEGGAS